MKRSLLFTLLLAGCNDLSKLPVSGQSCKGEWSKVVNGVFKKYKEYWHRGMQACVTEPVRLTNWEKSSIKREERDISCTPQYGLPPMWLKSANNFYNYRDGKIFIHLDPYTGIAKRLITGETENGKDVYIRQEFCFYLRTDIEIEPVNPQDYGKQILFDLELSSSSSLFTPMEIFKYDRSGPNLNLTRFDMNDDIDWTFCPTRKTPWGFCQPLRNGNIMFTPEDPSLAIQTQLVNEATLIRSEFNFEEITKVEFDDKWDFTVRSYIEQGTDDFIDNGGVWRYTVNGIPDERAYIGRAWRDYLRRDRPAMPDVFSPTNRIICYYGRRSVNLAGGVTGLIYGEICYDGDNYNFVQ